MDYVQKFDVELDKEIYYAGEVLTGSLLIVTTENVKVKGIRLTLRGKAHTEWKVNRAGERRTVKDDEYYIDEKKVLWGKDKHEEGNPIMPRGKHSHPFEFKLPETALPCSFESKIGQIRYYLRVVMDIPYASPPQGIKYFTIVGPHLDCMEDRYLAPKYAEDKSNTCCFCCARGPVTLQATLERSAYCCGENIRVKTEIQNSSDEAVWLVCKFIQRVEYNMNKGVLGLVKTIHHKVWERQTDPIRPHKTEKQDRLQDVLQVPVTPPTMLDVGNLIHISYSLRINVVSERSGEIIEVEFPIAVGTVPFRIPSCPVPDLQYEIASDSVEGGKYISSEFQLGQVYMGDDSNETDDVILYRPLYSCLAHEKIVVTNVKHTLKEKSSAQSKSVSSEKEASGMVVQYKKPYPGCEDSDENVVMVREESRSEGKGNQECPANQEYTESTTDTSAVHAKDKIMVQDLSGSDVDKPECPKARGHSALASSDEAQKLESPGRAEHSP